jgi:hypothetical protein
MADPTQKDLTIIGHLIAIVDRQVDALPLDAFELGWRQTVPEILFRVRMEGSVKRFYIDFEKEREYIVGGAICKPEKPLPQLLEAKNAGHANQNC